jgi:hypothetical protein
MLLFAANAYGGRDGAGGSVRNRSERALLLSRLRRNRLNDLPRDFLNVLLGHLLPLLRVLWPAALLRALLERALLPAAVSAKPERSLLPPALLSEALLPEAGLLRGLQDGRQNLPHDLVHLVVRQGALLAAGAAAESRHGLVLVLLRLGDELRQHRRDLLQDRADVLRAELTLLPPAASLAKAAALAKSTLTLAEHALAEAAIRPLAKTALAKTALPKTALPKTALPRRVLLLLRERLHEALQDLRVLKQRVLECVRLRVFGMHHDDLSSRLDAAATAARME